MSVLVLGGSGALGQAAISIALANDCTVFTTVSDDNKKQLLLKVFPALKAEHIGITRDNNFSDYVLKATDGLGCDVVLSCVKGKDKNMALSCCGFNGVTIDTIQISEKDKYQFGLHYLTKQRSYLLADFTSIFKYNDIEDMKTIKSLLEEGIKKGYVRPITHTTYKADDVKTAFKHLDSSRRSGRVVLKMSPLPQVQSRFSCSPHLHYLVVCEDGSGIYFADKLIEHGAKNILLHCFKPPGYLASKLKKWESKNVNVVTSYGPSLEELCKTYLTSNLKTIAGIYVLATDPSNPRDSVVSELDVLSRNCPVLNNFVIATVKGSVEEIYQKRNDKKLPVTVLNLPSVLKVGEKMKPESVSWKGATEAILQVLTSRSANVNVYAHRVHKPSLLKEIAKITDTEIPPNATGQSTLKYLGVPEDKTSVLQAFFSNKFNKYFETKNVLGLTVENLKKMDKQLWWSGFKDVRGLRAYFSYIDSNEVRANAAMMRMRTRIQTLRNNEIDVDQGYLAIIPGLEGHFEKFDPICERVKLQAITLQPGFDNLDRPLEEIAQRYAEKLLTSLKIKDDFYLLGYESGVLVALETAALIEEKGFKGTVFCLGYTPEEFQSKLRQNTKPEDAEFENKIIKHYAELVTNDNQAVKELGDYEKETWDEKVELFVEIFKGRNGYSGQYLRDLVKSAYARIIQALNYKVKTHNLKSKVVLINASDVPPKDCSKIFEVHNLGTPIPEILNDVRVAKIINEYLNPELVEAFEKDHRCETYMQNADSFITADVK